MDKITQVLKTITESELQGQNGNRPKSPEPMKSELLKPVPMMSGPVSLKSGINSLDKQIVIVECEEEGPSPVLKGPTAGLKQGSAPTESR